MGRSTKSDAIKTREHILEAAEKLFSRHGIGAVSVCQVAVASGHTSGAFYWHFASKDVLINTIFERASTEILLRYENFSENDGEDPLEAIERVVFSLFHEATGEGRLARLLSILLSYAEASSNELLSVSTKTANQRVIDVLALTIATASKQGIFPDFLNPERGARYLLGQLVGEMRLALVDGKSKEARTIGQRNLRTAVTALCGSAVSEVLNT